MATDSIQVEQTQSGKNRAAARLKEAEGDDFTKRFIQLKTGSKEPVSHDQKQSADVEGNYGIYAGEDLILVDLDDYREEAHISEELRALPETFTVHTPHDGEHRYFVVEGDVKSALEEAVGTSNPRPSWGELRVHNQYVVGPGSELDGCNKEGCAQCATSGGGKYNIQHDREVATVTAEDIVAVVKADPEYADHGTSESENSTETAPVIESISTFDGDIEARLERAVESNDDDFSRLWRGNYKAAGYTDRSSAECALAWKLAFWFDKDKSIVRDLMGRSVADYPKVDSGEPRKWAERTDSGYRDSVLKAVNEQPETYQSKKLDSQTGPGTPSFEVEVNDGLSITQEVARERCLSLIKEAYKSDDHVLIEALPTLGKSYGAVEAAADTATPVTILTQRHELYDQIEDWCVQNGLSYYTLPSFPRDCETYTDDENEELQQRVRDWYQRGAKPQEIHRRAEEKIGHRLPCQQGSECQYASKWKFDPDEYDILIGHFTHAYKTKAIEDRTVVFDEYGGSSYDRKLDNGVAKSVTYFLKDHSALPFDDFSDLMESRSDEQLSEQALRWFEQNGVDFEAEGVFDQDEVNAIAPKATYTLLESHDNMMNGMERTELPDGSVGLHDPSSNTIYIRAPPSLEETNGVVALDGTPVKQLWEEILGTDLEHRRVLTDDERRAYLTENLGLEIIQTTKHIRPYSSGNYVNIMKDRALIREIRIQHKKRPALISTKSAIDMYEESGLLADVDEHEHYGNLNGMNDWSSTRLGVVIGSRHFGDEFIKREAAFANARVEVEGRGRERTYGKFGDKILTNMREHQVLQAILRFGRDGNGAIVYVHTGALPEWTPATTVTGVKNVYRDGMKGVRQALIELDSGTTANIADCVEIGKRQVRSHLNILADYGDITRETEGRGYMWYNNELGSANEYGNVRLDID